MVTLLTPPP